MCLWQLLKHISEKTEKKVKDHSKDQQAVRDKAREEKEELESRLEQKDGQNRENQVSCLA